MEASIFICASTRGAFGTGEGSSNTNSFPPCQRVRPRARTSDPSRKPLASTKRALNVQLFAEGMMSPEALSTRKITRLSRVSTNNPL